jgi:hypothetical protein
MGCRDGGPAAEAALTPRGTIVLWSIAAALATYLWLTLPPARHDAEPEPAADTGPPLLDFKPEDVNSLVVTGAEGTLSLRRGPSGWRDDRDRPWPAPGLIETVLATLAGTRAIASIDEAPANAGDYGLDPPQRSVIVATIEGEGREHGGDKRGGTDGAREAGEAARSLTLLIGERNPAWTGVYARVPPADRVVLIGAVLAWEVDKLVGAARQAGAGLAVDAHR